MEGARGARARGGRGLADDGQRLQRSEVIMAAEKSALDLSATADAAPRPEATGQDSGTHSAKVQAEPEPEGQAQTDSSYIVESNIDQPGEVP